jgi:hypothetical protein
MRRLRHGARRGYNAGAPASGSTKTWWIKSDFLALGIVADARRDEQTMEGKISDGIVSAW